MTPSTPWHRRAELGSVVGMRITVWLYRRLGRWSARLLLVPIVAYFYATAPEARRASRSYLHRVALLPEAAGRLGRGPIGWLVFRHFLAFGHSILDRVGFWLGESDDFTLEVHGGAELDRVAAEGRGAVFLGSHLGSFDAMRLLATRSPIPVNLLMYTEHAARINGIFDRLAAVSGERLGRIRVIPVRRDSFEHALEARRCLERGEIIAILADRVPPGESPRVSQVDFLGGRASIPQGPFRFAATLGVPVLLMVALRSGTARYRIDVERMADAIVLPRHARRERLDAWCQSYADRLAAHCVRAPLQWFNFFEFWPSEARGV